MRCIFCLQEAPGTEEHVFPLAIGGLLTTDRLCGTCNSMLGTRVDAALCDSFIVRTRRARFGLAGNSGTVPALYEMLEGVGDLAALPGKRVRAKYNPATNKIDTQLIPHRELFELPDGSKGERITMDLKDIGQLPKILQRQRIRHDLPPLSQDELDAKVKEAEAAVQTIENPRVHYKTRLDFSFVSHAMLKIVYELAFLWLGEAYLDDPMAVTLREAVCKDDPDSTRSVEGWVGPANECEFFRLWDAQPHEHMAAASVANNAIVVVVRIFDAHAAQITVTKNASRYLRGADANAKIRFLAIDSKSRRLYDVPFMHELVRIINTPGADPLRKPSPSPFAAQ